MTEGAVTTKLRELSRVTHWAVFACLNHPLPGGALTKKYK